MPEPAKPDQPKDQRFSPPAVSLPKGGGAIKGIGEKFGANPVTGTGSLTIPLPLSPGRSGFTPALALSYDSGAGNGLFGFGWSVEYPSISRRTDRGLPRYLDNQESDVFILSGAEDLVPVLNPDGSRFEEQRDGYRISRYRPRIEGPFARIERWSQSNDPSDTFWRSISRDNVSTFYGKTAASRIADPADPTRIFTWLLCESLDDKGNAAVHEYVAEDGGNVDPALASESNRTEATRSANRYLKRVKYASRTSTLIQPDLAQAEWHFELVMDYGDHEGASPGIDPDGSWPVRPDPFSTYRAGFEVRTYRRCQRFLMFHRFPELGPEPTLVRSLALDYDDFQYPDGFGTRAELEHQGSTRVGSFLRRATVTGHAENGFRKAMPPLELTYSRPHVSAEARTFDEESHSNLPHGVDGGRYQWLDLNGEGISGVLTEQGGAWWYKPNLGEGRLGALQLVAQRPSIGVEARVQFLDLAGDGPLDLVQLNRPNAGFFERDDQNGWIPFTPFASQPNIEWDDPNLRLVDLTGNGHADVLITEDDVISWYPSLAEAGFGPRESLKMASDESAGPRLVFHDTTETVFLADMSGDGLSDLVRVRNGEVCYWPNVGYGRFGAKVTMDDAPVLDAPELFEPGRIRLGDIDGSGVVDILYLAGDGVRLYFNRSGNGWSEPYPLASFPPIDNVVGVGVTDLLGNGTACLVWSSPLPSEARAPLHYVDLMGNQKPHLLIGVENNLGARTRIAYISSTHYYLEDQRAGRPWITRLPFPVHVVERTEIYDDISRNRFVTRFAYHHGYFDGVEREFRGFGMVEQWDTEEFAALNADQHLSPATNLDASSHVPPVLTRTWFHTGVYFDRDRVSNVFAGLIDNEDTGEYYREPGLSDEQSRQLLLDDTVLPPGLSVDEEREACRALKGAMLRQEVYALDGTDKQPHPYSVSEQNFTIRVLQPRGHNPHAVFFPHPRESVGYHYERIPADPRVTHGATLEVDDFGNVLKSAAVAYGRRQADPGLDARDQAKQGELHVTYAENHVTSSVESADEYRAPLPCESRTYEVTGLTLPADRSRFTLDQLLDAGPVAAIINYERAATTGVLQKRVLEHVRTLYRRNDFAGVLSLGTLDSRAIPFEGYKLALTPGLITGVYGARVTDSMLANAGRYVHSEGDDQWWMPSGRVFYSPGAGDSSVTELANARQHFFLPRRYQDPFDGISFVSYDDYDLLLTETRDPLANVITVGERGDPLTPGNDYRALQPRLVTNPNGNRTAVSFDAIGMVVGTAEMGKRDETPRRGDLLDGLLPDLTDDVVNAHLMNPLADPQAILGHATTRLIYDLFAYYRTKRDTRPAPNVVCALVRETHDADLAPGEQTEIQHSFSYSDGFGREIQTKIRAEAGRVPRRDGHGTIILDSDGQPELTTDDISPRWVGSGWTVFNNKGKPVRQFEPFFTDTHGFEFDVRIGVSPILFYDPVERVVATLHPNHTWAKVIFDPWRQETWDVNDTVLIADPQTDSDVGDLFHRLAAAQYLPTWHERRLAGALGQEERAAAAKTAVHAGTPSTAYADSLERTFLTIAHNRFKRRTTPQADPPTEEFYATRVVFDIEGNQREVIDANDRVVMRYDYDMLGQRIHQTSMEAGERWTLSNVGGSPIYAWDSADHRFRTAYDPLRRPTETFLREDAGPERLIGRTVYGESQLNPEAKNQRGKAVRLFDQAGVVVSEDYDFKGNLLRSSRQLAADYQATLDWSGAVPLEADRHAGSSRFDALNRPTEQIAPDASVIRNTFNQANLLERVEANLRGVRQNGQPVWTSLVTDIDYDANGQRTLIDYGNGVRTTYTYDHLTLRLVHLLTRRNAVAFSGDCPQPHPAGWPGCHVQNLHYTYDPAGNITHIRDDAQQTIYFRNRRVEASAEYTYDAIYRLIDATGREHLRHAGGSPIPHSYNDAARAGIAWSGNDGDAMGTYLEQYVYDAAGNFQEMIHRGSDPAHPGWRRVYAYNESSLLEAGKQSNRLTSTTIGTMTETYSAGGTGYDAHGNMLHMPQLQIMQWDFRDQLRMTQRQAVNDSDEDGIERRGERTWYVYDAGGQRVRKVTEVATGQIKDERIYLGGFEIYRRQGVNPIVRETLHLMADQQRVALVETRTQGNDGSPPQLIRYQYGNHLGSVSLELDDRAQIVSYEEDTPYGSTAYQAVRSQTETPKRYRYSGMERDEESGLNYHAARYYPPWLGRWVSCDPSGISAGLNVFLYVNDSPVLLVDTTGRDPRLCVPVNDEFKHQLGATQCLPGRRKPSKGSGRGRRKRRDRSTGSDGGDPKGQDNGVEGGTGTKTSTAKVTEAGAGDGRGGLGEPTDVGTGTGVGIGTADTGTPTGTGTTGTGAATATETGTETITASGTEGGTETGTETGTRSDEKGEPRSGEGQGDAEIDPLTGVASLIIDPESLAKGKQNASGNGSPVGSSGGLIGGWLARVLTWIAAFPSLFWRGVKKIGGGIWGGMKKIGGGLKKLGGGLKKFFSPVKKTPGLSAAPPPKALPPDSLLPSEVEAVENLVKGGYPRDYAETLIREQRNVPRDTPPSSPNARGRTRKWRK